MNQFQTAVKSNPESFFHNRIMKMGAIDERKQIDYINLSSPNLWVLDERFMSYQKVFSDMRIDSIFKDITGKKEDKSIFGNGEPDVFVLLSKDFEQDNSSDVVIIELKDRKPEKDKVSTLHRQMGERIRALCDYSNPQIRRVFTFGVMEIDERTRITLEVEGYRELHGNSEYFYKYDSVGIGNNQSINNVFSILSWEALIKDAKLRNKTFLDVLKDSFNQMNNGL